VQFSTGEERTARVVGTDRINDRLLLEVSNMSSGIPVVILGASHDVEVSEMAIAISSPFGLEYSVTQSIISAVDGIGRRIAAY
jgi:putative serine protease PepD